MTTIASKTKTLPYRKQGEIDYDSLDFDPNEPVRKPDAMEQNPALMKLHALLHTHLTDFGKRPDIFLDVNTIICYDPANLNIRVSPDIYIATGVEAAAIRPRKIYLPWEVGKPPDWVIEIASSSTGRADTGRKRGIYAEIGVPEYWRFDPTGGEYHGVEMAGERLVNGEYRPIELTNEPDGVLKGYSDVLGLSLCWNDGDPLLYDPVADLYLEDWQDTETARQDERAARQVAEEGWQDERAARQVAEEGWQNERAARQASEAEVRRLREQLRRQGQ